MLKGTFKESGNGGLPQPQGPVLHDARMQGSASSVEGQLLQAACTGESASETFTS